MVCGLTFGLTKMVFDNICVDNGMMFDLTQSEYDRVGHAGFIQKREILDGIRKMNNARLLRIKNIVYNGMNFYKQESVYLVPKDIERLAADMMDLSISYAILWIEQDILGFNTIAVARTAHHTTNIDADVIEALIDKMKGVKKR